MTRNENPDAPEGTLRERAEGRTRELEAGDAPRSTAEADALLHELRVHRFELEMQNEELRTAQLALDTSHARYFDLYDLAPVGYVTVDKDGVIAEANLRACRLLQTERAGLIGKLLANFVAPDDQETFYLSRRACLRSRAPAVCEIRLKRRDGSELWARLESVAAPDPQLGARAIRTTISDISEVRRLRDIAAVADRMASLGLVAASVAHEINNSITYVLHHLQTLAESLPALAEAAGRCRAALLERVGDGAFATIVGEHAGLLAANALDDLVAVAAHAQFGSRHIETVARGLSFFSRVDPEALSLVDLSVAVERAVTMATNEIRNRAVLSVELAQVPRILGSDARLAQALLNLLINAAHAIPEGAVAANRVSVRTWVDGGFVYASVEDTGRGIPRADRDRIFEPFFTTKGAQQGTGLGLAITHRIVSAFGGEIRLETAVGKGSLFELRFPAGYPIAEVPPPPAVVARGGRRRVLVVDDDDRVRAVFVRQLGGRHDVVDVASAEAAKRVIEAGAEFDTILCDVMMPGVSGVAFHRWLIEHHPRQARRLAFVTGGAFTPSTQRYLASVPNVCLEKPIATDALRQLVASAPGDLSDDPQ